jgi:hypothetical protein
MKLNYLGMVGAVAVLTASCVAQAPSTESAVPEKSAAPAQVATTGASAGRFVGAEHSTEGSVRLVNENGQRYVEFDDEFKTDRGPDLFVLLHRSQMPQSYQAADYTNLGKLQRVNGKQRYAIPANVNPKDFRSVVVWCRQFNATFGYAPLGS